MKKLINRVRTLTDIVKYFLSATYRKKSKVFPSIVSDFIHHVISNQSESAYFSDIENEIRNLRYDKRILAYKEFGSGTQTTLSGQRKVCDIYRNMGIRKKYGRLLNRIVKYYQPGKVIELGTSIGVSTMYLAYNNSDVLVQTIEANASLVERAKELTKELELANVQFYTGLFKDVLPELLQEPGEVVVFIDGNHTYDATLLHYHMLKGSIKKGVLIFDDIYWSWGMKKAWQEIKKIEQVTIDLYQFGIVMIEEELIKSHQRIFY